MKLYVWQSGYGGVHVCALADNVEQARKMAENKHKKAMQMHDDALNCAIDNWAELSDKAEDICPPLASFDVSGKPDLVFDSQDVAFLINDC